MIIFFAPVEAAKLYRWARDPRQKPSQNLVKNLVKHRRIDNNSNSRKQK